MSSRIEYKNFVISSDGEQIEIATAGGERGTVDHGDVVAVTNAMQTLKQLVG